MSLTLLAHSQGVSLIQVYISFAATWHVEKGLPRLGFLRIIFQRYLYVMTLAWFEVLTACVYIWLVYILHSDVWNYLSACSWHGHVWINWWACRIRLFAPVDRSALGLKLSRFAVVFFTETTPVRFWFFAIYSSKEPLSLFPFPINHWYEPSCLDLTRGQRSEFSSRSLVALRFCCFAFSVHIFPLERKLWPPKFLDCFLLRVYFVCRDVMF